MNEHDPSEPNRAAVPSGAPDADPDTLASVAAAGFESESLTISDAEQPDWPLLFANDAFFRLTGWSPDQVIGRNCRVLQGRFHADNAPQRATLRAALEADRPGRAVLRNERPDGTAYWNEVRLLPFRAGARRYVLGLQRDLTRYVEAALRQHATGDRLAILDSVGDALFLLQGGHVVHANPAARRLLGAARPEELVGQPLERFIAPERIRQAQAHYSRVEALSRVDPYEIECRRLDGSPFVAEMTVTHSTFDGMPAVQVLMRDASARAFERGLLEHEKAALRLIAHSAPLHQVFDMLCRTAEHRMPGATASVEMLDESGRHIRILAAPSLPTEFVRHVEGAEIGPLAGSCGTAAFLDRPVVVPDIETDARWTAWRDLATAHGLRACWAFPFHHGDGAVAGTLAVYHAHVRIPSAQELRLLETNVQLAEIAVRQSTLRQALVSSEQQRGLLFDKVHSGLLMLDAHGNVLDANPAAIAMLAGVTTSLQGANLPALLADPPGGTDGRVSPPDAATTARWIAGQRDRVLGVASPSGGEHWLRLQISPIPDTDGRPAAEAHHVAAISDLTEIVTAQRALERTDALKNEFLAMLGHELRNPLAPVANAIQILRRAGDDARLRQVSLDMMQRQVTHLTRLVDDLLEVARIQQGRIQLRLEPVPICELLRTAAEALRPDIEARGHRLELDLPAESWRVLGDETRIVQVLSNLLNNAAKYTPHGGRITLRAAREDDWIVFTVQDDGTGIAPELLPHVFDLFTQAHRTLERAEGGLGIGLALVRRLVQMHRGQVSAASAGPGQGATFTVRLPAWEGASAEAPVPPPALHGDAAPPLITARTQARRRLLLVGPAPHWAESLVALLAADGHDVTLVADDMSPSDATAGVPVDLVLFDVGRLDDAATATLADWRGTPALRQAGWIAVTQYGRASDHDRLRGQGFEDVLVKPVPYARLAACLAELAR